MERNFGKSALFAGMVICLSFAAHAAPPFVTPAMMKRNGLTDAQYELLWKQGKNPQIDVATARDWIFRASRYANVVDWLEVCGKTNDFAKLSHRLQGENFELVETNKVVIAENKKVKKEKEAVEAELEVAEVDAQKARKIEQAREKAAKKDAKNLEKFISNTKKAKAKSSEGMAELYDAILELIAEAVSQ